MTSVTRLSGPARGTVSVEEAAIMLGIGRSMAYEAIRTDTFPVPVHRMGTRIIIPRAPLERLLLTGQLN